MRDDRRPAAGPGRGAAGRRCRAVPPTVVRSAGRRERRAPVWRFALEPPPVRRKFRNCCRWFRSAASSHRDRHRQSPGFATGRVRATTRTGRRDRSPKRRPKLSNWPHESLHSGDGRRSEPKRRRSGSGTTIAFIAEQTGVSVPTVSKVINGRADVAAATRLRVEAAIRQHGYVRSRAARSRADPGTDLPRARERVGPRTRPRRRARGRSARARGRHVGDGGPADSRAAAGSRASLPGGRPA